MVQLNLEIVLVHNRVVRRKSAERIFLHLNAHIGDAAVRRGGELALRCRSDLQPITSELLRTALLIVALEARKRDPAHSRASWGDWLIRRRPQPCRRWR